MSSKRAIALMAVLLLLLAVYVARPLVQDFYDRKNAGVARPALPQPAASMPKPAGPLPAANSISNLAVARDAAGKLIASFDYAYTGEESAGAYVDLYQVITGGGQQSRETLVMLVRAKEGVHRFEGEVRNPNPQDVYTTEKLVVRVRAANGGRILATASLDHRVQWPDPVKTEVERALASGAPETIVQKAAGLIDSGREHELRNARKLLQMLVDQNPRVHGAYVELARVAMKENWSPSGLQEAEALINSALQIKPDSVDAKILLGYVRAHQGRYKEAEMLLGQAAAANPPNLWLWANWGEVLVMQGKLDAGIAKYREAIQRPPTRDTYDRARWDAYANLLRLLQQRQDQAGMEALYKQRAQDYPGARCFGVDYARFLVLQRGDAVAAQAVLREGPAPACPDDRKRLVEGLVRYVTWAEGSAAADRADLLRQARVFHPVNPTLFYELSSSDRSAVVARQLLAAGEKIGMQDERQLDALTYALRDGETAAARRLLQLGANPLAEIGQEKMPVALVAVINRNFEGIRLMRRAGVDYAKLRYQGTTAVEYARQQGDTKLLEVLDPKSGKV